MVSTLPATPEAFIDHWTQAEELDAHSKRVQAQHPGLTLTGMYNVLEKLRVPTLTLTDKEHLIHNRTSTQLAALQEILESLAALGRARVDGERFTV